MFYGKPKYGNKKTEYKGRLYDSRLEANHAAELDLLKRAGEVKEWEPQFKLSLDVNGSHIANYICDFKVVMADGSIQLHETKGYFTDAAKLKFKLCQALYGERYKLVLIR